MGRWEGKALSGKSHFDFFMAAEAAASKREGPTAAASALCGLRAYALRAVRGGRGLREDEGDFGRRCGFWE